MRKNVNVVAGLFFLYTMTCWPLLLRYRSNFTSLFTDLRICTIFNYVMAITLVCVFLSMLAMIFKSYRTAFAFALIPFLAQLVLICSALLVFVFHRELTSTLAVSKLRIIGNAISETLSAPFTLLKKLGTSLLNRIQSF